MVSLDQVVTLVTQEALALWVPLVSQDQMDFLEALAQQDLKVQLVHPEDQALMGDQEPMVLQVPQELPVEMARQVLLVLKDLTEVQELQVNLDQTDQTGQMVFLDHKVLQVQLGLLDHRDHLDPSDHQVFREV